MAKYLTRDQVLTAEDLGTAEVKCPEWEKGGVLRVRGLTAAERLRIFTGTPGNDSPSMTLQICIAGIIDESGENMFTAADLEALGRKSYAPIQRLASKILDLAGIGVAAEEAAQQDF